MNNNKCFIIAELSANHGGKLDIALETIRAAKRSGADAIKIQTYTADTITLNSNKDWFKINQGTHWDGQYLYDLYKDVISTIDNYSDILWTEVVANIEQMNEQVTQFQAQCRKLPKALRDWDAVRMWE